jgi:hypothetical protein
MPSSRKLSGSKVEPAQFALPMKADNSCSRIFPEREVGVSTAPEKARMAARRGQFDLFVTKIFDSRGSSINRTRSYASFCRKRLGHPDEAAKTKPGATLTALAKRVKRFAKAGLVVREGPRGSKLVRIADFEAAIRRFGNSIRNWRQSKG